MSHLDVTLLHLKLMKCDENKKHINLVLSTILFGSIGFFGCSGSSSDSTDVAPKTVSGIAVDGYIKQDAS